MPATGRIILSAAGISFLAAAVGLFVSCRTTDLGLLPQERLAPDVVAAVDFSPLRLKRIGVMPFMVGEGPPWEEDSTGGAQGIVEIDAAGRFSASISRSGGFEVIPPERIASLLPPDMLEVTTRRQVVDLCRDIGVDAVFRGRMGMIVESARAGSGEVVIPFAFVTFEVELLDSGSGEILWFANHHLNSFQFLEEEFTFNMADPFAAQQLLTEKIPGYPDPVRMLTVMSELAIAEVAESFIKESTAAGGP